MSSLLALLLLPGALLAQDAPDEEPWDPPVLPGDLISLLIPEFADLSGGYTVNQFHVVTLPRLGELDVRGLTQSTLSRRVRAEYARIFRTPGIEVQLTKRIRVLGSVNEPGLKNVNGTMTVADALALAAGRTPDASQDRLQLRRNGEVIEENAEVGRLISDLKVLTGDELYVPQRSWLSRNLTAVATSVFGALTVIVVSLAGS